MFTSPPFLSESVCAADCTIALHSFSSVSLFLHVSAGQQMLTDVLHVCHSRGVTVATSA